MSGSFSSTHPNCNVFSLSAEHRIETKSDKYPSLSLGFASAPVSLEEQIMRTPEQTPPEWFAIERG